MSEFLSTQELEQHIRSTYVKVEPYAKGDGFFIELGVYFSKTPHKWQPHNCCYSDEKEYRAAGFRCRGGARKKERWVVV
jgi:hypothetical protein